MSEIISGMYDQNENIESDGEELNESDIEIVRLI
jgi:hypothetical protein